MLRIAHTFLILSVLKLLWFGTFAFRVRESGHTYTLTLKDNYVGYASDGKSFAARAVVSDSWPTTEKSAGMLSRPKYLALFASSSSTEIGNTGHLPKDIVAPGSSATGARQDDEEAAPQRSPEGGGRLSKVSIGGEEFTCTEFDTTFQSLSRSQLLELLKSLVQRDPDFLRAAGVDVETLDSLPQEQLRQVLQVALENQEKSEAGGGSQSSSEGRPSCPPKDAHSETDAVPVQVETIDSFSTYEEHAEGFEPLEVESIREALALLSEEELDEVLLALAPVLASWLVTVRCSEAQRASQAKALLEALQSGGGKLRQQSGGLSGAEGETLLANQARLEKEADAAAASFLSHETWALSSEERRELALLLLGVIQEKWLSPQSAAVGALLWGDLSSQLDPSAAAACEEAESLSRRVFSSVQNFVLQCPEALGSAAAPVETSVLAAMSDEERREKYRETLSGAWRFGIKAEFVKCSSASPPVDTPHLTSSAAEPQPAPCEERNEKGEAFGEALLDKKACEEPPPSEGLGLREDGSANSALPGTSDSQTQSASPTLEKIETRPKGTKTPPPPERPQPSGGVDFLLDETRRFSKTSGGGPCGFPFDPVSPEAPRAEDEKALALPVKTLGCQQKPTSEASLLQETQKHPQPRRASLRGPEASPADSSVSPCQLAFSSLGLSSQVAAAAAAVLRGRGERPTETQCVSIPQILEAHARAARSAKSGAEGRRPRSTGLNASSPVDCVLTLGAATGSGKTLAFMLSALEILKREDDDEALREAAAAAELGEGSAAGCEEASTRDSEGADFFSQEAEAALAVPPHGPRVLVVCPSRALVTQVGAVANSLARRLGFSTASVFGGCGPGLQRRRLLQPVDVLVGTPDRIALLSKPAPGEKLAKEADEAASGRPWSAGSVAAEKRASKSRFLRPLSGERRIRPCVDLRRVSVLILDEVDELWGKGFREDTERLLVRAGFVTPLAQCAGNNARFMQSKEKALSEFSINDSKSLRTPRSPSEFKTDLLEDPTRSFPRMLICSSATPDTAVEKDIRRKFKLPQDVFQTVGRVYGQHSKVQHEMMVVGANDRFALLVRELQSNLKLASAKQVLIFCNTVSSAQACLLALTDAGLKATVSGRIFRVRPRQARTCQYTSERNGAGIMF